MKFHKVVVDISHSKAQVFYVLESFFMEVVHDIGVDRVASIFISFIDTKREMS